jgi:glycosyltransferase involved in cell wall biosynthesis
MRVLVVMPAAECVGGAELTFRHLVKFGRGRGVEWFVAFLEDGPMVAEVRDAGVPCEVVDAGRVRDVQRYPATVARLARLARRTHADLVCSWMGKAQLYAGPAAALARVPAVWYQHGFPAKSWMDCLATKLPTRGVITTSDAVAAAQRRIWPARRTLTVHPGVDLESFDPALYPEARASRERLGLEPDPPTFGFVGRLQHWKGVHLVLEAFARVLEDDPSPQLVVVGGPHRYELDYADSVRTLAGELDVAHRVHFAGAQQNVAEWVQAMDIVVHASGREPFGMVIAEAMAMEKAVVASAAGGPSELIDDGVNGLLFSSGDAGALADCMSRLLSDPALAQRLGEAARTRAHALSADGYAERVVTALHEAIHRPRPTAPNRVAGPKGVPGGAG